MKEKIFNKKILFDYFIKICLLILIIILITFFIKNIIENKRKSNINDSSWLNNNIKIVTASNLGKNIMTISTKKYVDIYNQKYQNVINAKINKMLKTKKYTLNNPLIIYNPYGTNSLSFNIYFTTSKKSKVNYKISVDEKDIPDYSNSLYNENKYSKNHEYQIVGLIKNKINNIKIEVEDVDGNINFIKFQIKVPNTKSNINLKLNKKKGTSSEKLENGLYAILGHDKSFNSNIYLYDNNGILRSELPLKNYRTDRIEFINDNMFYSYKKSGFISVNRLGKIDKIYDFSGYTQHHDYIYDKKNNKILILTNEKNSNTIEDIVISLDLSTGKINKELDMKEILYDMYKTAIKPKNGNTYGGDELDWIHLNSLDLINDKDVILSSRELSSLIYISDIYNNPKLKYIISDSSMYQNTKYEKYLYSKDGNFVSQAGQHTITYINNDSNTYYLAMYNNNFGSSRTRPNFDWSNYKGVGTYNQGNKSMYYLYEVSDDNKNYKLVKTIDLPYSSIVSSIQNLTNNFVTSSGMSHSFGEYDSEGNLITQFNYTSKKYAYRVFKYNFSKFWFN